MPLLQILIVLIVVGVLLWLVNRFIAMQGTIKSILNAVVIIAVALWLLNVFGLFHSLSRIHVGTQTLAMNGSVESCDVKTKINGRQQEARQICELTVHRIRPH